MMHHKRTASAANGKWRGLLLELGLPAQSLTGKHGPCPMCEGTDRFRWDNSEGRGTYICSSCGSGDGMALAMAYTKEDFQTVASRIDVLLGNIKFEADKPKVVISDDQRRDALRDAWKASAPMQPGDLAHQYLQWRGVEQVTYPKALRFSPAMRDGEGGVRPCMLALVGRHGQERFDTMHRTFLKPDGSGKAEMPSPRKLMAGELPDGACVMLSDWTGAGALGIAEGIETALAAGQIWGMPVWAAINATNLAKWMPPEGCDEVAIFGDNDPKFAGQAAAFRLAHKLACKGLHVTVHIPPCVGTDWNDELLAGVKRLRVVQ